MRSSEAKGRGKAGEGYSLTGARLLLKAACALSRSQATSMAIAARKARNISPSQKSCELRKGSFWTEITKSAMRYRQKTMTVHPMEFRTSCQIFALVVFIENLPFVI